MLKYQANQEPTPTAKSLGHHFLETLSSVIFLFLENFAKNFRELVSQNTFILKCNQSFETIS